MGAGDPDRFTASIIGLMTAYVRITAIWFGSMCILSHTHTNPTSTGIEHLANQVGRAAGPAFEGAPEVSCIVESQIVRHLFITESLDLIQVKRHVLAHQIHLLLKSGVVFLQFALERGGTHGEGLGGLFEVGSLAHVALQVAVNTIDEA